MATKDVRFGGSVLQIKKFNISEMVEHCTIAMIAKRASGKSYLTKEIMYHKRDIASAIAISRTEKLNKFYSEIIPDSFIYSEYEPEILSKIYERQSRMNNDNARRVKEGKKEKDDRIMLIMDDCMSSKGTWLKDPNILELFFNGRHHHLAFILTMQFSLGIPPELRSNFDYIFLLAEDMTSNRKRLYDHYAGMFPTFDIFQQVFNEITEDYGCMVINNRIHSKNITDKVFWYKAKPTPSFKIGSERFIKFHKETYDKEWDKRVPLFDTSSMSSKRNAIKLIVEKVK
jgi:hypothetical protein|uniref:Uncharacterized protein n=1 Tax=viral metagenome TaxID=1070528 RepID=A0A6C0DAA5_9ZZZZ